MVEIILRAQNLEFRYPGAQLATIRLEKLELGRGEKVFLQGASGSGKSTLLELFAGVLSPQKGQLEILAQAFAQMSPSQKDQFRADHIGYIFQSFNLVPYLSVIENAMLPLIFSKLRKNKVQSAQSATAEDLLVELGLQDHLHTTVSRLSVGQQQRVAAARALLGDPDLILADEPTSALDMDHRQKFIELIFRLANRSQSTILFVSHDRNLENLFDRSLSFGKLMGQKS